jgi:hypothetical protein
MATYGSDQRAERALDRPWWREDEDSRLADGVCSTLQYLQKQQINRSNGILRNARLYMGSAVEGFGPYTYARMPAGPFRAVDRLTLNVIASNIDTLTSKQAKNRPRPRFLTIEGDFKMQRKAKNLQRFVDGVFFQVDAYKLGVQRFRDACWAGTGTTYWFREGGKICAERVFPGELYVDEREALYGEPRQLFRVKYPDRGRLKELFPEKADMISRANPVGSDEFFGTTSSELRDTMKLVEAWHLPSGPDAGDGKYVAALDNGTLQGTEWTRPDFPFVCMSWRDPLLGFWGTGIADELTGIQVEINKLLRKIQDCFHLLAVPWVLRERGSQVNPAHLTNQPGIIIDYTGTKPEVVTHATVHPEVFAHLDRLVARSYEITGVSQLSAMAQKPAGLDSGRALQEYHDIESERFMEVGRRYEASFLDDARQCIALAREISASPDQEGIPVKAVSGKGVRELRWKEVSLDDDAFVMQVFASSALPTQPAAKIDRVLQLMQAQLIDPAIGQRLLEFPDIEAYTALRDAPIDDIEAQVELLLDGDYEPPEPYQDLGRAGVMVQSAYLRARREGASEEILGNMRRFLSDLEALKGRLKAAEQAEAMAAQAEMSASQQMPQSPGAPPQMQAMPAMPQA